MPRREDVARVALGEVLGAHGTRGELRLRLLGDDARNLARMPEVTIGGGPDDPAATRYEVTGATAAGAREARLSLRGIESREAAAALAGLVVSGETRHLAPLAEGEHYGFELVGCVVETPGGQALGRVRTLWETRAHDVLVVEGEGGKEILLPAAAELLREVDVERGRIVIEVPEGLLDPTS